MHKAKHGNDETCIGVSFSRYENAPRSLKDAATRRLRLVERIAAHYATCSATAAIGMVAGETGTSAVTLKRYWSAVEGRPWSEWLPALVPAYKGRQPNPIPDVLWQAFLRDYGRVEQPQLRAVWERVKKIADGYGLPCPSEKTFQRRFKALPADVQVLMREGTKALADRFPHQARDRSGMLPLDSVNSDGREWDLRVTWPDGTVRRPVVTLAEDDATHFVVAYEVDAVESGAGYRRVFRQICRAYGVPRTMRYDNTRAAANKALTAGAKGRKRFKDRPDDLDGLLKEIGTEVSFARVENGKTKGAERVFAEIKERTEKHPDCVGAYTGRSPSEKPANYGTSALPLATFERVLREEVERYNTKVRTRSTVVAVGASYASAFAEGLARAKPRRLTETQDRYLFRAKKRLTPNRAGEIFIGSPPNRHRYHCEALFEHAVRHPEQPVIVRYDENDMAQPVYVEDLDGRCIASAAPRLEAGAFNSKAQAAEHGRARKQFARAAEQKRRAELDMQATAAAGAAAHEPEPEAPTPVPQPAVVTGAFAAKARPQPQSNSAAPQRDPAKLAALRAQLRGENPEPIPDDLYGERWKRGQERLAGVKAG